MSSEDVPRLFKGELSADHLVPRTDHQEFGGVQRVIGDPHPVDFVPPRRQFGSDLAHAMAALRFARLASRPARLRQSEE